ncbi:MAG: hypothetical protein ABJG78_00085 [Cyclobacteriaceae bacterium]
MFRKTNKFVIAALIALMVWSCNDSGNDPTPEIDSGKLVTIKGNATYGAPGGRIAADVGISQFLVNVEEIELKIDDSDSRSVTDSVYTDNEFQGPFILDLLSDTLAVDLAQADLPKGIYDELEFDVAPSSDASSPLDGKSILISGDIAGVPFTFWTDEEEEFEINFPKNGGDLVVDSTGFVLVINFELNTIFGPNGSIDLSRAKDGNGDGTIEIHPDDPDGNNILAVKILSELEDAVEIEEDKDEDEDGEGEEDEEDEEDETDDEGEDEAEANEITMILTDGTWVVSFYSAAEEGTALFESLTLTFNEFDDIVAVFNETEIIGEWEAITNTEPALLLLEFEVEDDHLLENLEDDWNIVLMEEGKLELEKVTDGFTKELTITKQ